MQTTTERPETGEPAAEGFLGIFTAGNNAALATALALAGIPWHDEAEPCRVEWDAELLAKSGCRSVSEANARRRTGRVAYNFAPSVETKAASDAFDATNDALDRKFAAGDPIEFLENLPAAFRAEIVATVLRVHRMIAEAPFEVQKHRRYWIREWEGDIEIEPAADGKGGIIRASKSIVYRADAPEKLIEEMEEMR